MLTFSKKYTLCFWIFPVLIILLPTLLQAQKQGPEKLDSLLQILPKLGNDTNKVNTLASISFTCFPINPNLGLAYGEKSRKLALKLNFSKGLATTYNSLGANYWAKHDFLRAQDFYLKAMKINKALNRKRDIAGNIHNLGTIYESQLNYSPALTYYQSALKIAYEIKNEDAILGYQANIANIYQIRKKYPEAIAYLEKSVELATKLNRKRDVAAYLSLISVAESEMGNFSKAAKLAKKALVIFEKIQHKNPAKDDIPRTLLDLAAIYEQSKNHSEALYYNKKALQIFEALPGNMGKGYAAQCLNNLGLIYQRTAASDSAVRAFKRSIILSRSINDWKALTVSLKSLSEVQQSLKDYPAALQSARQYAVFKDSVYNIEMNRRTAMQQMEFEFNMEKDSLSSLNQLQAGKIKLLSQERTLDKLKVKQQWFYFLFIIGGLCFIGIYYFYNNRLKQIRLNNELTNEKMEKQLQEIAHKNSMNQTILTTLISQMNPHFIFNALNTIQSYIYSNDKKLASDYLVKFSDLTRKILDNSRKQLISLEEELNLLYLYLDIEKARFGKNLDISINIQPEIDTGSFMIPPMLIQPFVENAIKHGLLHRPDHKKLNIEVSRGADLDGALKISIEDNGIGREQSKKFIQKKNGHNSFASSANEKRINIINYYMQEQKIKLDILDKKNQDGSSAGTTVLLQIPVMHYIK